MKVWLDDKREAPDGWERVYTAEEAIELLRMNVVTEISLDHDLGDGNGTGYDVASYIERAAHDYRLLPLDWSIHSSNPVGVANIRAALLSADRFWQAEDFWPN